MKWIPLALALFTAQLHAHFIGELFEETIYGRPGVQTKIKEHPFDERSGRRVYTVTFSSKFEANEATVVVSAKTGKIVRITSWHDDIYDALHAAAFCIEGEVSIPTKMTWPDGMPIKNVPGPKHRGRTFSIHISKQFGTTKFMLEMECLDYMSP